MARLSRQPDGADTGDSPASIESPVTEIEQLTEARRPAGTPAYTRRFTPEQAAQGSHRDYVGGRGKWDQMGKLQMEFLRTQGLRPDERFLDVGCGSFRAGVHLVDYLEQGNYYGIDVNPNIIRTGYDHELTDDQRVRLPQENLRATDRFDADFGVTFDKAIAQSVFTHISLNLIRLCLYRIAKVMRPGAVFYTTIYDQPASFPLDGIDRHLYTERNTFWYYRRDLEWAASFSPWEFTYIGEWGHPRGQKMIKFTRVEDRPARTAGTARPHRLVKRLAKRRTRTRH